MQVTATPEGYIDAIASLAAKNVPPGGDACIDLVCARIDPSAETIIDVGCNTGWTTCQLGRRFPRARVIGVDISDAMIAACERRLASCPELANVEFRQGDGSQLSRHVSHTSAVVSFGSTAFISDLDGFLREVRGVVGPAGVFLDVHYVYPSNPGPDLHHLEQDVFGVVHNGKTCTDWLRTYEASPLQLSRAVRLPQYALPGGSNSSRVRQVIREIKGTPESLRKLLDARDLADSLAKHRVPMIFEFRALSSSEDTRDSSNLPLRQNVLDVYRTPIPREPIHRIRAMNPYEFLAYVGDPDVAPGGSRGVAVAIDLLKSAGVAGEAPVLDVGSFTGLSTLLLGKSFPRVVGIDLEPHFVRVAQTLGKAFKSPASYVVADARQLPWPDASFEAIAMTATLGYSPQPERILRELRRALKPEGVMVEFLYDYPKPSRDIENQLRRLVSADIRVARLSDRLKDFDAVGMSLSEAVRIESASLGASQLSVLAESIIEYEGRENRQLGPTELREFRHLVEQNMVTLDLGDEAPSCYCCLFQANNR